MKMGFSKTPKIEFRHAALQSGRKMEKVSILWTHTETPDTACS